MSNFVVTGGSGFIGGHLVEYLEEMGHTVTIFDIKEPDWFKPQAEIIIGDILSTDDLMAATEGSDCIFDCSGVLGSAETFDYFEKTLRVNALGTLRVLDVAKERGIPVVYIL
jgi:Nucleoside-diphosphate-sugar epimerases